MLPAVGRMDVFRPLPDGRFERTRQLSADDVFSHADTLVVSHQRGHQLSQYDREGQARFTYQVEDDTHIGEVRPLQDRYLVRTGLGLVSLEASTGRVKGEFRFNELGFQRRLAEWEGGLALLDQGLLRHFTTDLKPLGQQEVGFLGNSVQATRHGLLVGEGYPGRLALFDRQGQRRELSQDALEGVREGKDGRIWFIEGQTRRGQPRTVVGWSPSGEARYEARPSTHSLVPLDSGQVLLWEGRSFALRAGDGELCGNYPIGDERLLKQFFLSPDQRFAYAVCIDYGPDKGFRLLKLDLSRPGEVADLGPVAEDEHPQPSLARIRMDSLCEGIPPQTVLDWQIAGSRVEKTDTVFEREAPPLLARGDSRVLPGMTVRVGGREVELGREGVRAGDYQVRLAQGDELTGAVGLESEGRGYLALGTRQGQVLWCDLEAGVERFSLGSEVRELVQGDGRLFAVGSEGQVGVLVTPGLGRADGRSSGVREEAAAVVIGSVRVPRRSAG